MTNRPIFSMNLEELSKEDLISMIQFYRNKEKIAKEIKLGISNQTSNGTINSPSNESLSSEGDKKEKRGSRILRKRKRASEIFKHQKSPSVDMDVEEVMIERRVEKSATKESCKEKADSLFFAFEGSVRLDEPELGNNLKAALPKTRSKGDTNAIRQFIQNAHESPKKSESKGSGRASLDPKQRKFTLPSKTLKPSFDTDVVVQSPEEKEILKTKVSEILDRLRPDHNKHILSAEDAMLDSPIFRHRLIISEKNATNFLELLKKIGEETEYSCQMGYRYVNGMESFNEDFKKIKEETFSPVLELGVGKLSTMLIELHTNFQDMIEQIVRVVSVPAKLYADKELNSLKELQKHFHKVDAEYEEVVSRYSKRVQKQKNKELEEELNEKQQKLRVASLDLIAKINEIEALGKINLIASVSGVMDTYKRYFDKCQDSLLENKTYMGAFCDYLKKCKSVVGDELKRAVNRRLALKKYSKSISDKARYEGYLFCARKVKKGKGEGWERSYFVVDSKNFTQYKSEGDKIAHKKWDLLLTSVKTREDLDRTFAFELTSMVPNTEGKMHPEILLLQAENQEIREIWLTTIRNAINDALSHETHTTIEKNDNTRQELRLKIPMDIKEKLTRKNSKCVDCNERDPEWTSINLGIMMCIECAGVHRNMGVSVSMVRSTKLDQFDIAAIKILMVLSNSKVNAILEEDLTDYKSKIPPTASRVERENFIKSKYESKDFMVKNDSENLNEQILSTAETDDLEELLRLLLHGADPNFVDDDGHSPLHRAVLHNKPLVVQLLLSNGAQADKTCKDDNTALHLAAEKLDKECISVLVLWNAKKNLKNASGHTPEEIAKALDPDNDYSYAFTGHGLKLDISDPHTEKTINPSNSSNKSKSEKEKLSPKKSSAESIGDEVMTSVGVLDELSDQSRIFLEPYSPQRSIPISPSEDVIILPAYREMKTKSD